MYLYTYNNYIIIIIYVKISVYYAKLQSESYDACKTLKSASHNKVHQFLNYILPRIIDALCNFVYSNDLSHRNCCAIWPFIVLFCFMMQLMSCSKCPVNTENF